MAAKAVKVPLSLVLCAAIMLPWLAWPRGVGAQGSVTISIEEPIGLDGTPGFTPAAIVDVAEPIGLTGSSGFLPAAVVDVAEPIGLRTEGEPFIGSTQATATGGGSTTTSPPSISSFSPTSGPPGTTLILGGASFTEASAVTVGGVTATFTVTSATRIVATVPTGAATGPIGVTGPGGAASSSGSFTVTSPTPAPTATATAIPVGVPTISAFSPTTGAAGAAVTIAGTNFTGATQVSFGGVAATFVVNSNTQITATVPSTAVSGRIAVTTPGGTATSSADFTAAPRIGSFSPAAGGPGTQVVISGANFTGATSVKFGGISASFTVNSAGQITATVPAGAFSGPISVTTIAGTAGSSTSFVVAPRIASFSPASGVAGVSVTITGANLNSVTAVTFGGAPATFTFVPALLLSPAHITATVPTAANTGRIVVTNPGGTGTSSTDFTAGPRITSFSPTSGLATTRVTINGANFTGASAVTFNGVSAPFTVVSAGQITTTVPLGATTGRIAVRTPVGTGTSSTSFTVGISGFVLGEFVEGEPQDPGDIPAVDPRLGTPASEALGPGEAMAERLPRTGVPLPAPVAVVVGLAMLGAGLVLRRRG